MRTLASILVGMLLITMAPVALAGHATDSVSGSYTAGTPAWLVTDACDLDGATEGVSSNCVDLPSGFGDHAYTLEATDGVGVVGLEACWWTATGDFISCGGDTVPSNAAQASVGSIAGVDVSWTLTLG